jgi:hypothetical protein
VPHDPSYLAQLLANPQETLAVEFKNWLDPTNADHRPKIAKELLALANHGGGYLIFGFEDKSMQPDPNKPTDFVAYSPDSINSIVKKWADPAFQCEVHIINRPGTSQSFPIVCVPGEHRTPIRCKAGSANKEVEEGRYYMRLSGPESGTARSSKDWDDMLRRCLFAQKEQLLGEIRSILTGHVEGKLPNEALEDKLGGWIADSERAWAARLSKDIKESAEQYYPLGAWTIAYKLESMNGFISVDRLANLMKEYGDKKLYPSWDMAGGPVTSRYFDTDTTVEFLRYANENHWRKIWTAYARLSQDLDFYLKAGYAEDIGGGSVYPEPGKVFYTANALEFLLRTTQHASHICRSLNIGDPTIIIRVTWNHAAGRRLFAFTTAPDAAYFSDLDLFHAITDRETIEVTLGPIEMGKLESNFEEVVLGRVQAVFRAFNLVIEETRAKTYVASVAKAIKRA